MVVVQRSTVIDAPISAVWDVLRDFNGHDQWHPAVSRSHIEGALRSDQPGAVRNFVLSSGEKLREQLLTLSDRDHSFRYAIIESDIPLMNYVAEVALKPVTDGDRTFWSWKSRFDTPKGQENELRKIVAEAVYEAGFEAVRARVARRHVSTGTARSSPPVHTSGRELSGTAMAIDRYGGPDEFHPVAISAPAPGPGEVQLRQKAIGVNFIDVYCRTGYFKLLNPPGVPGMEAAGIVEAVGSDVTHLAPGMRVAYACPPVGAYASVRTMDAALVVPLPENIGLDTAAAFFLKGITATFLTHRIHPVHAGETVLIYAPAGGVGQLLCQWASRRGATVIGATSSEDKARVARAAGAHHVVLPGPRSLADQVRDLTDGRGADVIYDAVGKDTFEQSVAALATCGHLISYGQASGDIGSWDISSLAANSATLSRPNYAHYTDTPDKLAAITTRLFDAIESRILTPSIARRYPLSGAADAHSALESRKTTGATILIPD